MFTHLHLHTEYSLLDGLTRISPLIEKVKAMGQEAVAMTDHGAMYGAIEFYKTAKANGIKPIIGVETYVAPGSRHSKEAGDNQPYHLTLLAKNKTGYRNLLKLVTASHLEGYYYRPRIDRELIEAHGSGIIALSGCPSGEMHRLILEGRIEDAKATANWYRNVFDGYYFEVQSHDLPEFRTAGRTLVDLSREMDIPLVATNDSHYLNIEDHEIQDLLLCIQTNATVSDEKRMKMSDPSYHVRSEAEMRAAFPDLQDAVDNTWKIAEMCDLELEFDRLHLPQPDLPPRTSSKKHLETLCWEGLRRRLPDADESAEERLRYELEVVEHTGFTNYMHIVREIAMFARGAGMRMGVRGSAAASLILYCLGVTDIDPLKANLVFERFLNKERPEAPDVDFDFPEDRRDEVLRFVAERYGADRVAQIITFGTMGAKAAIRDVGRALGMTYADVDRVARLVPNALHMTIERALNESNEMKQVYEADPQIQKLVDSARRLEGVARHASTHAAGVVIGAEPLVEHLPLARPAREAQAMPMTQFTMGDVAAIGLVKMDLLGLANLTILDHAVRLVREHHGVEVDLEHLPDEDELTFAPLAQGDTFGVFQMESAGMRRAVQELKPTSVGDLAALVALYRPGPMQHIGTFCRTKHGIEQISYPHPDLADILDETYGVITFQDQVLKIAQKFAGYSLGAADIMRKAMGKKIAAMMQAERERFLSGAVAKGYTMDEAKNVFDLIEPFAGYAFNKAHSYSYGTIAYQTAYLKAHYPVEYMTAVLMAAPSHPAGALERIAQAYNECIRLGIPVLAADVNRSQPNFSIETTADGTRGIRFGIAMIKNVGHGAAESLVESRGDGFASLDDFCRKLNANALNKRALESLVKAGALDDLVGRSDARGSLLLNVDRIMNIASTSQRLRETGQATMFDLFGQEVATPLAGIDLQSAPVPKGEVLAWEKELLGIWLSEHPYTHAAPALAPYVSALCSEVTPEILEDAPANGRDLILAGIVGSTRRLATRDGRAFIAAELEDLSGTLEVTVWPDVYEQTPELWTKGKIILALVRIRERGDRLQIGVQQVVGYEEDFLPPSWIIEAAKANPPRPVTANGNGAAPATTNGNGNGNGHATPAPAAPVAPLARVAEPPPIYDEGEPTDVPPAFMTEPDPPTYAPPEEPVTTEVSGTLSLVLEESGDDETDQRRLASVFAILQSQPGNDAVFLTVRTRAGEEVELALPSARLDAALRDKLREALGAQMIRSA